MVQHKLDIFDILRAVDNHDGDWWSRLSSQARSGFVPLVALRWAATVDDGPTAAYMLWLVNDRVNTHLHDLSRHPKLVYRLMASCGLGQSQRHQWLPGGKTHKSSSIAHDLMINCYPDANDLEITLLLAQYDVASFTRFVADCGIQPTEAKDIVKAFAQYVKETK